jgi:iron(III) transport system substrate-binding protein
MFKLIICLLVLISVPAYAKITIYTDRPIEAIADAYTRQTGVEVELVALAWPQLRQLILSEGVNSSADLYVLKDLVYINELKGLDLLAPHQSELAHSVVDPSMVNSMYTAITFRTRTLTYHESLDVSAINTYMDLANPKYAGMLCLRTSSSPYNVALFAGLIQDYGFDQTYDLLDGWLNNMVDPTYSFPNDRSILASIVSYTPGNSDHCQMGINSSYYVGQYMNANPNGPLRMKMLTMNDGGVSTNGIVSGVARSTSNSQQARDFMEFLLSERVQDYLSQFFQDFPANRDVAFPGVLGEWFGVPLSTINWADLDKTTNDAQELFQILDYQ